MPELCLGIDLDAVTTDLVYLHLHRHEATYAERARGWLAEGRDVRIYSDNTAKGAAPDDARRILRKLKSAMAMSDGPARFS